MHLAPTDEQQAIQQEARRFLAAEITRERRLAWDATAGGPRRRVLAGGRRARLVRLRRCRRRTAGRARRSLDLGLLIEECGRAVAPFGVFAPIAGGLALDAARHAGAEARVAARRRARRAAGDARGRRGDGGARADARSRPTLAPARADSSASTARSATSSRA